MSASIHNIVVDCRAPWQLAQFWSDVLARPVDPENAPADDEVGIPLDASAGELLFLAVPEPKTVKNRLHLCLQPDGPRDEEVERLLGIGATLVDDQRRPDGTGWAVLADPEGNEFCILRSAAERAATS
jgi:hypothetical protein